VPLLIYVIGVPSTHVAIRTSAIAVAISAAVNLFGHAHARTVKWPCAIVFAAVGVFGAAGGAQLGKMVDGARLLTLFGVWPLASLFIIGGALGGLAGIRLGQHLGRRKHALSMTFAGIIIAVGIYVIVRSLLSI
jgi:uncharacterized membrane protein YfcA